MSGEDKEYPFENIKGEIVHLSGELTIRDLMDMGYTNFRIDDPEAPLRENEWRSLSGSRLNELNKKN